MEMGAMWVEGRGHGDRRQAEVGMLVAMQGRGEADGRGSADEAGVVATDRAQRVVGWVPPAGTGQGAGEAGVDIRGGGRGGGGGVG